MLPGPDRKGRADLQEHEDAHLRACFGMTPELRMTVRPRARYGCWRTDGSLASHEVSRGPAVRRAFVCPGPGGRTRTGMPPLDRRGLCQLRYPRVVPEVYPTTLAVATGPDDLFGSGVAGQAV